MKFYTYKLSEQAKPELAVGDLENDAILYPLTQFDMQFADMNELRIAIDDLENHTSAQYWPYPTYGDLLFSVK